jgi:Uncharacterized conserved protein
MLRRSEVERGYFVRAIESERQLAEVLRALQLEGLVSPFTRCRECNTPLVDALAEEVAGRVPPRIQPLYERYRTCPTCHRVYWEGSHFTKMKALLARAREASLCAPDPGRAE